MPENKHKIASPAVVNVEDLRSLARRRLPKVVFDYLDGGAEDEITLRENRRAFEEVAFRPRNAVAIAECDLRTRVLGHELRFPRCWLPSVIAASCTRAARRRQLGRPGKRERDTYFQPCRGIHWKK